MIILVTYVRSLLNILQETTGKLHITNILCTAMDSWEGKTKRYVAPSCVVRIFHDNYPAPDGNYLGIRDIRNLCCYMLVIRMAFYKNLGVLLATIVHGSGGGM